METTEEIVAMVRGLRGDLVDCLCTAMSSAECSCCMTWPEDFAEPAADMIERLMVERDQLRRQYESDRGTVKAAVDAAEAAEVERNEWMRRSEIDKAHSDRLTQNLFDALARAEKLRKFVQQLECECDSYFSFTCERCVALRENNYD